MPKENTAVPESITELQAQLEEFRSTHPHRARLPLPVWQSADWAGAVPRHIRGGTLATAGLQHAQETRKRISRTIQTAAEEDPTLLPPTSPPHVLAKNKPSTTALCLSNIRLPDTNPGFLSSIASNWSLIGSIPVLNRFESRSNRSRANTAMLAVGLAIVILGGGCSSSAPTQRHIPILMR